jgi:hypothetical protein
VVIVAGIAATAVNFDPAECIRMQLLLLGIGVASWQAGCCMHCALLLLWCCGLHTSSCTANLEVQIFRHVRQHALLIAHNVGQDSIALIAAAAVLLLWPKQGLLLTESSPLPTVMSGAMTGDLLRACKGGKSLRGTVACHALLQIDLLHGTESSTDHRRCLPAVTAALLQGCQLHGVLLLYWLPGENEAWTAI